jgi:arginyl-tRNA--protein-N-Asp/Glu arginylyltransferase
MYLHWDEKTITDFSERNISEMYARGYVFTRKGKGVMHHTRSIRIDLEKFYPSSENRRIVKKTGEIRIATIDLPYAGYTYTLGKLAKVFYDTKFGAGTMSAQKIKELITSPTESNFNLLFTYNDCGYAICYGNKDLIHYSYPFYDLNKSPTDMGMSMMVRAIHYAKNLGLKHIYLGSLQRPGDTYKLQFSGLEWFDGKIWSTDIEEVKKILKSK